MTQEAQVAEYQLYARVVSTLKTSHSEGKFFIVETNEGHKFRCRSPQIRCPLFEGDGIIATVRAYQDENGVLLQTITYPLISIPTDKLNIVNCLTHHLGKQGLNYILIESIYKRIVQMVRERQALLPIPEDERNLRALIDGDDGVAGYLSNSAVNYKTTKDGQILINICNGVFGAKPDQIDALLIWWYKNRCLRRLQLLGLTETEINNSKLALDKVFELCITNSYRLPALPIQKAEFLFRLLKEEPRTYWPSCGKIIRHIYSCLEDRGWTATPMRLLGREFPNLHQLLTFLKEEFGVKVEFESAYLEYPYRVETFLSRYLNSLIKRTIEAWESRELVPPASIYRCSTLNDEQKKAIQGSLFDHISIITGPGGSGKSTIINEMIFNLRQRNIPFAVCAFTGKAVSRLQEIMGDKTAMTIDRMIVRASSIPPFRHLFIDEASMVTYDLFYRLVTTFTGSFKITLIGDENQLPPIGWGFLLRQLILSERVPVYRLTVNHRIFVSKDEDDEFDRILFDNSHALIDSSRDLSFPLSFKTGTGFEMMHGDIEEVFAILSGLKEANIEPSRITLICPYYEEYNAQLNRLFQHIFILDTPPPPRWEFLTKEKGSFEGFDSLQKNWGKKWMHKEKMWCVGDRVMMLNNNYEKNVMNGDEGIVIDVSDEGVLVEFRNGETHKFSFNVREKRPWDERVRESFFLTVADLDHSTAVTVHKSQGSEYEFVILFIPRKINQKGVSSCFVNINLLYVAMTRARRGMWVIGDIPTIEDATRKKLSHRHDHLSQRLISLRQDADNLLNPVTRRVIEELEEEMPEHEDFDDYEQFY